MAQRLRSAMSAKTILILGFNIMTLIIDSHPFSYEMENLCRLFYPQSRIKVVSEPCEDDTVVYTGIKKHTDGSCLMTVRFKAGTTEKASASIIPAGTEEREVQRRMAVSLWKILSSALGCRPQWGILTGVRPLKLFGRLASEKGEEFACGFFRDKFLVSPEKTELARTAWNNQKNFLALSRPDYFSLYIAIPFCPTRCSYCSFVSSSVEKAFHLVPQYVDLLCDEIRRTAQIAKDLRLHLQTVYIGGGTPTVLSASQLANVIGAVNSNFDLSLCREFTVEAGRPDTITEEKLKVMKSGGVTRISINPQTLNDEVLREIGRKHTSSQIIEAFGLARRLGFDDINMDIIAGLPKDSLESFLQTIHKVIQLSPECVTVHTLSIKKAARLNHEKAAPVSCSAETTAEMLRNAYSVLPQSGYHPYYLYRQSRMVGNLENTGWSKPGRENLYNVLIMEECQTILACGASAVTKLKDPYSGRIERIFNFKYPYEYIGRYKELIARKNGVKEFYGTTKD